MTHPETRSPRAEETCIQTLRHILFDGEGPGEGLIETLLDRIERPVHRLREEAAPWDV